MYGKKNGKKYGKSTVNITVISTAEYGMGTEKFGSGTVRYGSGTTTSSVEVQ